MSLWKKVKRAVTGIATMGLSEPLYYQPREQQAAMERINQENIAAQELLAKQQQGALPGVTSEESISVATGKMSNARRIYLTKNANAKMGLGGSSTPSTLA